MNLNKIEQLIENHQSALIKHSFFIVKDLNEAEDIVQDSFVKFYRKSLKLDDKSKAKSYLFQIVHNASIDFIRSIKANKSIPLDNSSDLPDHQIGNYRIIPEQQFEILKVNKAIGELPFDQSEVIKMRIFSDLSYVEISNILQIPISTVKSRFKYGINKLKMKIGINKEVYYEM